MNCSRNPILNVIISTWLVSSIVFTSGCRHRPKDLDDLFGHEVPQNYAFKKDLNFLKITGQMSEQDYARIEREFGEAQAAFGVPKSLLWCLLFQESRFDALKNASHHQGARGLGQFTTHALREINVDTDHFDDRTGDVLAEKIKPRRMPINFALGFRATEEIENRRNRNVPRSPPRSSYYNTGTAVFASAAYLNNRYQQIKQALDHQGVLYDPEVIWLYAAAAYNKGARTVFNLLSQQRTYGGEEALTELMMNPKTSYALLTHRELLDFSMRELWDTERRERYIKELTRSMETIFSCVIPEGKL